MISSPLLTVLMPVYNGERYLALAIESILNQTFKDFEFLIFNDGSTDRTEAIILSFEDERIRYIKNEKNIRLIATLNKGLKEAKGMFIARMDADDISLPERFKKQVAVLQNNKDIGVCGSWVKTIGENGGQVFKYPAESENLKKILQFSCEMCHPVTMFRTALIRKYQITYREEYLCAEDWKFWMELTKVTEFYNVSDILLHYRLHETNISITGKKHRINSGLQIRKENFNELEIQVSNDLMAHFNNAMEYNLEGTFDIFLNIESLITKIITEQPDLCDHNVKERLHKVWMISLWKSKIPMVKKGLHLIMVQKPFNLFESVRLLLKLATTGYLSLLKRL